MTKELNAAVIRVVVDVSDPTSSEDLKVIADEIAEQSGIGFRLVRESRDALACSNPNPVGTQANYLYVLTIMKDRVETIRIPGGYQIS